MAAVATVLTYYPDLPDFSKYNIRTEKGYSSDSEIVNLDTQKKKAQLSIGFKDFEFIKMLGKGAYGGVYLVKKKNSNDIYAMKVIDCSGKVIRGGRRSPLTFTHSTDGQEVLGDTAVGEERLRGDHK